MNMLQKNELGSNSLSSIQLCRGLSAILVLLFHNSVAIFSLPKYWNSRPFGNLFDFGHAGVEFFFVLSGFIIFRAHYEDIGRPSAAGRYVVNRLKRIYPVYWICLLLVVTAFSFVIRDNRQSHDAIQNASSIFLIALRGESVNPENLYLSVSWTLFHEILFYAMFTLIIFARKIGFFLFIIWISASALFFNDKSHGLADFYFSPLHVLFLIGIASCLIAKKVKKIPSFTLVILGISIFLGAGFDEVNIKYLAPDVRSLVYGIGSAVTLIGLVSREEREGIKFHPMLSLVGDASYSIYLIHLPVLSVLAKFFSKINIKSLLEMQMIFIIMSILTIFVGVMFHLVIERPLLGRLRRRRVQHVVV